jgi:hypothetical protein
MTVGAAIAWTALPLLLVAALSAGGSVSSGAFAIGAGLIVSAAIGALIGALDLGAAGLAGALAGGLVGILLPGLVLALLSPVGPPTEGLAMFLPGLLAASMAVALADLIVHRLGVRVARNDRLFLGSGVVGLMLLAIAALGVALSGRPAAG